jgi:flagellar hook-associated protein 2
MSTTTPAISFSGLASGIDTSSVITSLVTQEQAPITQLQTEETNYNNALTDWQQVNTDLSSLQTAANTLTQPGTFTAATASSSNTSVASITAAAGAQIGQHSLTVNQLAQAQKVVSGSFTSGSTALGETGSFTLNGQTISVSSSDTLNDVASEINASSAGVTATVVHVGTNNYRLTLAGNQTGLANALSAADNGTDTVLSDLGLISGSPAIRDIVTDASNDTGAGSIGLNSATQTVANALGQTSGSAASGAIQINGVSVNVNLNTDSLNTIASNINNAGITGITAEVVSLPDANGNISGSSPQQLEILSSTGTAPAFTDSNNVLQTLGITQTGFTSTITQAQDAQFNLDGLNLTRSSNTITDAVPGATINLLSGSASAPGTTTLNVSQDTNTIISTVQSFVSAYNTVQTFINQENTFTAPASGTSSGTQGSSPPLFGDTSLLEIQRQLNDTLNSVTGGASLTSIGLTLNSTNNLTLDTSTLTTALQNNSTKVANLFGLSGTSNNSNVQFVSGTTATQTSTGTGYAVNITQAATQSTVEASTAQTGASTAPETLTFSGALFNNSNVTLTLPQGNTLQDTVNQINSSSVLSKGVYATIDSTTGALEIASLNYGSGTDFTASSNLTSGGSGIGIGTTVSAGVDVAGTINNEPATGKGRTLTANGGNNTTTGITLLVSAATAGSYGNIQITHGVADALNNNLTQVLDPTNGSIQLAENSLNTQISNAQTQIKQVQDQVTAYQAYLTQMFSAMETQVAALQEQGAAFAAQTGTSSSSSSSTGTASVSGGSSSSS